MSTSNTTDWGTQPFDNQIQRTKGGTVGILIDNAPSMADRLTSEILESNATICLAGRHLNSDNPIKITKRRLFSGGSNTSYDHVHVHEPGDVDIEADYQGDYDLILVDGIAGLVPPEDPLTGAEEPEDVEGEDEGELEGQEETTDEQSQGIQEDKNTAVATAADRVLELQAIAAENDAKLLITAVENDNEVLDTIQPLADFVTKTWIELGTDRNSHRFIVLRNRHGRPMDQSKPLGITNGRATIDSTTGMT